jgi:hypothetical protein
LLTKHVRLYAVKDENRVVCSRYSRQSFDEHW